MINVWGDGNSDSPHSSLHIVYMYWVIVPNLINTYKHYVAIKIFFKRWERHNHLLLLPHRRAASSSSWAPLSRTEGEVGRMRVMLGSPRGSLGNGVCPQVGTSVISPLAKVFKRSLLSLLWVLDLKIQGQNYLSDAITKTWEINFKRGKVHFGSWVWRFQSMVACPIALGLWWDGILWCKKLLTCHN